MKSFTRSFSVTIITVALVLILVLTFVLINENVAKSGFSSGEVLSLTQENGRISGEIMGESFDFSTAALQKAAPLLQKLTLLLPPPVQLLLELCSYGA